MHHSLRNQYRLLFPRIPKVHHAVFNNKGTTVVENEVSQNLFIDFWSTCEEKKTEEASLLDYVAEFEQLVGEHINTLQASCAGGFRDLENKRFKLFQVSDSNTEMRETSYITYWYSDIVELSLRSSFNMF